MTVTLRPVPAEALTQAELAERLKVSGSTIRRWVAEGCPHERWGPRLRRFDPTAVRRWARERHGG